MHLPDRYYQTRRLETLVEQCTTFSAQDAELHIYETHQQAEQVSLRFRDPVLTSMLQGKKVMHLEGMAPFDYLPGSSVLVPAHQEMRIDFPEASSQHPTRCLALAIAPEKIQDTLHLADEHLDHQLPKGTPTLESQNLHLLHDNKIQQLLQRIINLFVEGNRAKDTFIDLSLKELLIRLMQGKARQLLLGKTDETNQQHRISATIHYIREHLEEELSVAQLAGVACLSESHFYKCFRETLGMTPTQFITRERIRRAQQLLQRTEMSISQISLACGFRQQAYFNRCFKEATGTTPSRFKKKRKKPLLS